MDLTGSSPQGQHRGWSFKTQAAVISRWDLFKEFEETEHWFILFSPWAQEFKEIFVRSLATCVDRGTEVPVTTHDEEYNLCKNSF